MPRRYKCPAMQEGYTDRIAGLPIETNPYMTPPNRDAYERGWYKIGAASFKLDVVEVDGVEMTTAAV